MQMTGRMLKEHPTVQVEILYGQSPLLLGSESDCPLYLFINQFCILNKKDC